MWRFKMKSSMRAVIIIAGFVALTGCGSLSNDSSGLGSSNSSETIRVETTTAPTDLQLICASRTAETFQADENTTIPIGSKNLGGGKYSVTVKMADKQATCIIDDDAKIISIED